MTSVLLHGGWQHCTSPSLLADGMILDEKSHPLKACLEGFSISFPNPLRAVLSYLYWASSHLTSSWLIVKWWQEHCQVAVLSLISYLFNWYLMVELVQQSHSLLLPLGIQSVITMTYQCSSEFMAMVGMNIWNTAHVYFPLETFAIYWLHLLSFSKLNTIATNTPDYNTNWCISYTSRNWATYNVLSSMMGIKQPHVKYSKHTYTKQ